MTREELQNSALPEFHKFCEKNEVKPTNMKADYYIAGYYQGLNNASRDMWSLSPDEIIDWLKQEPISNNEWLIERLINIANGYRVNWKHNSYDIIKVFFIKHEQFVTSVMVSFKVPEDGYRLEHLPNVAIVPF